MSEFNAFLLGLLTNEVGEVAPWLAEKLIRFSVRALPVGSRQRYGEEYLAELENVPGKIFKLIWAFRVFGSVYFQRRELSKKLGGYFLFSSTLWTIKKSLKSERDSISRIQNDQIFKKTKKSTSRIQLEIIARIITILYLVKPICIALFIDTRGAFLRFKILKELNRLEIRLHKMQNNKNQNLSDEDIEELKDAIWTVDYLRLQCEAINDPEVS